MKKGFTLAELAIVLLIVGLLVTGIVLGGKLIAQGRIVSSIAKLEEYVNAFTLFEMTYEAVPGDMANAHDVWGSDCAVSAAECNGDGDGIIEWNVNSNNDNEYFRSWQHVSLAGIIPDEITGVNTLPRVPFIAEFGEVFMGTHRNIEVFKTPDQNRPAENLGLIIGGTAPGGNVWDAGVSVMHARSMDQKIDDGAANTGKILGIDGANVATAGDCSADKSTLGGADYNLNNASNDQLNCAIIVFLTSNL